MKLKIKDGSIYAKNFIANPDFSIKDGIVTAHDFKKSNSFYVEDNIVYAKEFILLDEDGSILREITKNVQALIYSKI